MNLTNGLLLAGGLFALTVGAELLVRGASALAALLRISSLTIGLTVVAFGTSAPELAVSIQSSMTGQPDLAMGNVVGSNIFNVLLILGLSALITPLVAHAKLVRFDVPLMIGASILLYVMAFDGRLQRIEGLVLSSGLLAFTAWTVIEGRRSVAAEAKAAGTMPAENAAETNENERQPAEGNLRIAGRNGLLVLVGLGLLVAGSNWFVSGAVGLARSWGMSELVIGLTIIAAGTSLPEVATSILAAIKGERDIAVGNVVGSNLFNILGVLGIASVVSPTGVAVAPPALSFDLPIMIAVAVACLPIFFTGNVINRWEGGLFFAYYLAYVAFLTLNATRHDALPVFSRVMLEFALPLTILTLLIVTFRQWTSQRS